MYNLSLPFGMGIIEQINKNNSNDKLNSIKPSSIDELFKERI